MDHHNVVPSDIARQQEWMNEEFPIRTPALAAPSDGIIEIPLKPEFCASAQEVMELWKKIHMEVRPPNINPPVNRFEIFGMPVVSQQETITVSVTFGTPRACQSAMVELSRILCADEVDVRDWLNRSASKSRPFVMGVLEREISLIAQDPKTAGLAEAASTFYSFAEKLRVNSIMRDAARKKVYEEISMLPGSFKEIYQGLKNIENIRRQENELRSECFQHLGNNLGLVECLRTAKSFYEQCSAPPNWEPEPLLLAAGSERVVEIPIKAFLGGGSILNTALAVIQTIDLSRPTFPAKKGVAEIARLYREVFRKENITSFGFTVKPRGSDVPKTLLDNAHKCVNEFAKFLIDDTSQPENSASLPIPRSVELSSPGKADKPSSESSGVILVTVKSPLNVTINGRSALSLQSKRLLASMACFANLQDSYHVFDKYEVMSLYDPHKKANLSKKEVSNLFGGLRSSCEIVSDERRSGKRVGTQKKVTFSNLEFRIAATKEDLKTLLEDSNPPIPQRRKKKS